VLNLTIKLNAIHIGVCDETGTTRSYKSSLKKKTDDRSRYVVDAPRTIPILAFLHRIANTSAKKESFGRNP
jgi:hypothetical protein